MGESGRLLSAPAGAFPRMMSREMTCHNGLVYRMSSVDTESFPARYRGPIRDGSTFRGQDTAVAYSSGQAVNRQPAEVNFAMHCGQKQLPDDVDSTGQAVLSPTVAAHCVGTRPLSATSIITYAMPSRSVADVCSVLSLR